MSDPNTDLWRRVRGRLLEWTRHDGLFRYGQENSLAWMAEHITDQGLIIADEVGLGKTRLALFAMIATLEEGGHVAVVVPPGLLFQWQAEAQEVLSALQAVEKGIRKWRSVIIRSYSDLFRVLGAGERFPLSRNADCRWVLISQAFDVYRFRGLAQAWCLELPSLVKARWAKSDELHSNSKWIQYARGRGLEMDAGDIDEWLIQENRAADYLSRKRGLLKSEGNSIEKDIWENERLCPQRNGGGGKAGEDCTGFFKGGRPGRRLLMMLVGHLIGDINLLILDEAHKSREDGDVPEKRLGRLLEKILRAGPARKISVTATPIELGTEQWFALLRRTGIGEAHHDWPRLQKAIGEFSKSHLMAMSRPNQPTVLDALIANSNNLQKVLAPYVTRRRRINQHEMIDLLKGRQEGAHPHRDAATCDIRIETLSASWRKRVLAMEGQGLAGKGLSHLGHAQKQADIRYSSGLDSEEEVEPAALTGHSDRKTRRHHAWKALFQKERAGADLSSEARLWDHPRIRRAADRIEDMLGYPSGPLGDMLYPSEKVLVFGTFTKPMEALRDVLNARFILRALDMEEIAFAPEKSAENLLFFCYMEWFKQKRFSGALKGEESLKQSALIEKAKRLNKDYTDARQNLYEKFSDEADRWIGDQPGDGALRRLKVEAPEVLKQILSLLRFEIFDELLMNGRHAESVPKGDVEKMAHAFWVEHLECILHGEEEVSEKEEEAKMKEKGYATAFDERQGALSDLDAKADRLKPEQFQDYLGHELRSQFCRLLNGSVKPKTRRSVQASFNRKKASPFVLIAQSVVGREGLNLHKACRRVFLFHPEWNPGVIEQQIGRVDRIESLWTRMALDWDKNGSVGPFPKIEVESLVFRGTYDEYQSRILSSRKASLNAQLFGALLDDETLMRVPSEYVSRLAAAAPDWEPPSIRPLKK